MPPVHSSRRTARRLTALVAASFIGALAGAGAAGAQADADPARVAPRSTIAYFEADLAPGAGQAAAFEDALRRVGRTEAALDKLKAAAGDSFVLSVRGPQSAGVLVTGDDYFEDFMDPWLGSHVAWAVTGLDVDGEPTGAFIAGARDAAAAQRSIATLLAAADRRPSSQSYRGVDYWSRGSEEAFGVVDSYVVLGDVASFKAVVNAARGRGLTSQRQYVAAARDVEGSLAFAYFDPSALRGIDMGETVISLRSALRAPWSRVRSLVQRTPSRALRLAALARAAGTQRGPGPITAAVRAAPKRLEATIIERGVKAAPPGAYSPSRVVATLPADVWLAGGAAQVGRTIDHTRQHGSAEERQAWELLAAEVRTATGVDLFTEIIPVIGDTAYFLRGRVQAGVVIETPDPPGALRLLDRLRPWAEREGQDIGLRTAPTTFDGAPGFRGTGEEREPGQAPVPVVVNAIVAGNRVVIALGDDATRAAIEPPAQLGSSSDFQVATQSLHGAQPSFFVAFGSLANMLSAEPSREDRELAPHVRALRTLAGASTASGDRATTRYVLTMR